MLAQQYERMAAKIEGGILHKAPRKPTERKLGPLRSLRGSGGDGQWPRAGVPEVATWLAQAPPSSVQKVAQTRRQFCA